MEMKPGYGGVDIPPSQAATTVQHAGLTVAAYAEAKRLDPERLRAFGLSDIFYSGEQAFASPMRCRRRRRGRSPLVSRQGKGRRQPLPLQERLQAVPLRPRPAPLRERGYSVLVEGESDCHTLWTHGEPAVGVPGANNWNESRDAAGACRHTARLSRGRARQGR